VREPPASAAPSSPPEVAPPPPASAGSSTAWRASEVIRSSRGPGVGASAEADLEPKAAPPRGSERAVRDVPSVAEALARARQLGAQGDRQGEVSAALGALKAGATGYERVEALKRACDGFEALEQPARAESFCAQLLAEFPETAAAQQVARRRGRQGEGKAKAKVAPLEASPAAAPEE
jgi:hypothetical protein